MDDNVKDEDDDIDDIENTFDTDCYLLRFGIADSMYKQMIIRGREHFVFVCNTKDELNERNYSEINDIGAYKKNKDFYYDDRGMSNRPIGDQNRRSYVDRKGTARLFIAKGRNDNMDPRKLVDFIQHETGIDQRHIDDVKMFDAFSFFAVPFEDAEKVLQVFQKQSGGRRSLVTRAKEKK